MPIVAMPDGAQVSFPDEMPPDQIRGLILQKFPDAANRAAAPSAPDVVPAANGQPAKIRVSPSTSNEQVAERFGEMRLPASKTGALQSGLQERAANMTQGAPISPVSGMLLQHENVLSAAEQGATPDIAQHQPNLISNRATVDESGNLLYIDPATGQLVPTDSSKHVALRDPSDNQVKIYARNDATNEGPVTGVSRVLAQGYATGAPTARPGLPSAPVGNVRPSELFSEAKPFYRAASAEAKQIEVGGQEAKQYVARIKDAMEAAHSPEHLAPEVYKSVERVAVGGEKAPSHLERLEAEMNGRPIPASEPKAVDLEHLRSVRELVSQSFRSPDSRVRQAAGAAVKEIDRIITEKSADVSRNLKRADQTQAAAHGLRKFDSLTAQAGAMETRKLYRGNVGEKMREYLSKIVAKADDVLLKDPNANTKTITGFHKDEIEAFRQYVDARKALRYAAEASPTKGIMRMFMEGAAAHALGPGALAIPGIGYASHVLARILDARQLNVIRDQIARRSPDYAKAVEKAALRWARSHDELVTDPSPNRIAAFIGASRALSSGLTRDGVKITSGDLVKLLSSPSKGAAEDQQGVPGEPTQ